MAEDIKRVLTINSCSSSIKFSLYHIGLYGYEGLKLSGKLERIGLENGAFEARDSSGKIIKDEKMRTPGHEDAVKLLFDWIKTIPDGERLDGVGHKIVHGGTRHSRTSLINKELILTLKRIVPFAPERLPYEIKAIEAIEKSFPEIKQIACFDTAFHRNMPEVAKMFPIPLYLRDEGVIRYGFHGLSYEYILSELKESAGDKVAAGRVIIARLGNGCSMAAVSNGKPVDTTMGFTPLGGLIMGTRAGDMDPGVIIYLLKEKGLDADQVNELLSRGSGLLGLSGLSSEMRDLLNKADDEPRAAMAVDLFCYQARKFLGGLIVALGGVDTFVFTGGIGENSPEIREKICRELEFLGIVLDAKKNASNASVISHYKSHAVVRVIKTNEERMIARHTVRILS
ncbi:MAG: acetate/propionate family kinase [Deltaproteobacteria bacterium]|nr:acetate/propionate family kinase [Deltaproteobacteria bacterium]